MNFLKRWLSQKHVITYYPASISHETFTREKHEKKTRQKTAVKSGKRKARIEKTDRNE